MKKQRPRLSISDWEKLKNFAQKIAKNIQAKLPSDWYITIEDIESAVLDTFLKLIDNYKPGAQSITSYCWQYAEKYTFRDLMREYKSIKNQVSLDEFDDDDESGCNHKYGLGNVPSLTVDERDEVALRLDIASLLNEIEDKTDRKICEMIMAGEHITDISKELNIPIQTVYNHWSNIRKKYYEYFQ